MGASFGMRPLRFVSWGIVLAIVVFAASVYGDLPARIPVHVRFDGTADRFADRSMLEWSVLPGLALLTQVILEIAGQLLPDHPELISLPAKDRFLRLPAAYRGPVLLEIQRMMDLTAAGIAAIFGFVTWQMVSVALARPPVGQSMLLVAPILLTAGLLLHVRRITSAIDREDRRWRDVGSPTA